MSRIKEKYILHKFPLCLKDNQEISHNLEVFVATNQNKMVRKNKLDYNGLDRELSSRVSCKRKQWSKRDSEKS